MIYQADILKKIFLIQIFKNLNYDQVAITSLVERIKTL